MRKMNAQGIIVWDIEGQEMPHMISDSSVFGDGLLTGEQKIEMRGVPWIMPVGMFEKLAELHPDCLISPEFAGRDHYRFGGPAFQAVAVAS